ncbi:MAG TPA: GNAT family N-acetyltransferase [Jatrophihabitantaceae bacterium]|nr:GNAT family N-acetyltransferase [Jatrophihabitantaceae bacterium]
MISLRPMTLDDLPLVRRWLDQPHVARWWLSGTTIEAELDSYARAIRGDDPTFMRIATRAGEPVGFGQWYAWRDYPKDADGVGARPGDCGIDYALGEAAVVGSGAGTELVAALVADVRRHRPDAGIITDPEATNHPSRRVLEKNGFTLVAERPVPSELVDLPMAIYRLAAPGETAVRLAGVADAAALAALRAEWSTGSADVDAAFVEQFENWLRAEGDRRVTWIGDADGAVVGMLNLSVFRRMPKPGRPDGAPGTSWGYVSNVYVRPAQRRGGLGTLLVAEAVRYARAFGMARLVLNPSDEAAPLYARAGFVSASELMMLDLGG